MSLKQSCVANKQVDVLIIGGGLVGAAFMLALSNSGIRSLLVDARGFDSPVCADFDARSLALSPASERILSMLNVWPKLSAYASSIQAIHVSEQRRFGQTRLQRASEGPLGHVVEMQYISRTLHEMLPSEQLMTPAKLTALNVSDRIATIEHDGQKIQVKADLIVAADGAHSYVRELCGLKAEIKDYKQHALVANIGLNRAHKHWAYERFTPSGPLALLPMTDMRASLVWSLNSDEANKMKNKTDGAFLQALQHAFGYRLGRFVRVGQRSLFPLRQVIMPNKAVWPVVFVGNAAQTLHPVAGQGFNLGLRDVALLAQCIVQDGLNPEMLKKYESARCHDQAAIAHLTHGLIELFSSRTPGLGVARSLGLLALDNTSFLKRLLSRYASGYAGVVPDLVCGIPLANTGKK